MADWFGSQGSIARYLDTGSFSSQGPLPSTISLSKSTQADLFGLSSGASAIASLIGAFNASSAQKKVYQYQAQVAANNTQIANWQASQAIVAGQQKEEMSDLHTGQVFASQRAAMAANGVDLSEGSPTEVLASTQVVGNIDAATIKTNALNQAWGYQADAVNSSNKGQAYSSAAKQVDPYASAATSLLTSTGNVASKWYGLSSVGAV